MNRRRRFYHLLQFHFILNCQSFLPSHDLGLEITKQGRNSLGRWRYGYFLLQLQGEKQKDDQFCSEDTTSLLRLALSMTISQALHAAVEWGLFDILQQKQESSSSSSASSFSAVSIKDLAHAAKSRRPDDLLRVLRLLAAYDIVQEQPSHNSQESPSLPCFRLSRLGACLAQGAAVPGHSLVKYILDNALWKAFTKVPEASSLSVDQMSAFELANHQTAADYYGATTNPQAVQHANIFVRHISDWEMESCANANSIWETAKRVVDLGGYHGQVLEAIQQKHPHLDCICLDLPDVVDQRRCQKSSSSKVQMVPGNMFDSSTIPTCDTIFMKHIILCEFDAQDSEKILQSCYTVLPPGGRVIVAETLLPDHPTKENSLPFQVDVFMMLTGRDRSLTETEWLVFVEKSSGFRVDRVIFTDCPTCSFVVLQK